MKKTQEKDYYKEKIIELVEKIENLSVLVSIYSFIKGLLSANQDWERD